MRKRNSIVLLLSTYNGARYLPQLLNSLASQSYHAFDLIVRDDFSSDRTITVIREFAEGRLNYSFLESAQNVGPMRSFSLLLEYALTFDYEYFMFVDQDDVWLPSKIENTLEEMMSVEMQQSPDRPVLVHTDLTVVNESLLILSNSFWKYQNLKPQNSGLSRILMQNVVTGAAMMINRPLAEMCKNIPNQAIMHDWWIALVSSAFGYTKAINYSTILYRQHGYNEVGAKEFNLGYVRRMMSRRIDITPNVQQAKAFKDSFQKEINEYNLEVLLAFISLSNSSRLLKILTILKYRFFKIGILRNIGLILNIFRDD